MRKNKEKSEKDRLQYREKKWYEITINPNDKLQFWGEPLRFPKFMARLDKVCKESLEMYGVKYELIAELSNPHINVNALSAKPRLHFHGRIKFETLLIAAEFQLLGLYKLSRQCNITINEYRGKEWDDYTLKNEAIMNALSRYYSTRHVLKHKTPILKR